MRIILGRSLFFLSALLLAGMVTSLFLQVLAREFVWEVDWSEEMARFTFIGMVFFASVYATLTNSHLKVSFFSDYVARRIGERPVQIFHSLILICFDGSLVWYSWFNLVDGIRYPNISPSLGFNQNYLFLFMIIGFSLAVIIHLLDLIAPSKINNSMQESHGE